MMRSCCLALLLGAQLAAAAMAPGAPTARTPEPAPHPAGEPAHTDGVAGQTEGVTVLEPETFDEWVQGHVHAKRTAFVRWVATDDVENCSWVKLRHPEPHHLERETEHQGLAEVKDSPNETGAEGPEGAKDAGAEDEVKAQELADKPEPTETDCQLLEQVESIWAKTIEQYENDSSVVFGDVVLSSWKDLVGQVTKMRTVEGYDPDQDEDGTHPHLDTHFAENIKAIDFMFADFAEVAHQKAQDALNGGAPSEDEEEDAVQHREHHVAHHNFGCTVRHYNLAVGYAPQSWSPECVEFVHNARMHAHIDAQAEGTDKKSDEKEDEATMDHDEHDEPEPPDTDEPDEPTDETPTKAKLKEDEETEKETDPEVQEGEIHWEPTDTLHQYIERSKDQVAELHKDEDVPAVPESFQMRTEL